MAANNHKTIAEKIFTKKSGRDAQAGDLVLPELDFIMFHDGTFTLVMEAWEGIEGRKVEDPSKIALIIDHSAPAPTEQSSNLHGRLRNFAKKEGIKFYDVGNGICHQLVPEQGHVVPGDLVIGADSHTVTYGALNVFSTGVGATDLAAALHTGKLWFQVPETIRVDLTGEFSERVYSKDLILWLAGKLGADGATYKALEFGGPGLGEMSMEARFTVSNMAIELGGKAGLMEVDEKTLNWAEEHSSREPDPVEPDPSPKYERTLNLNLSDLVPMVAKPHEVDNVAPVEEVEGKSIDQALIGTCTNGRLEDLKIAADLLEGQDLNSRLIIAPASQEIYTQAMEAGFMKTLVSAGAAVITPGCGPCLGTHNGIPADGENVISTANRNFKGRMGNEKASIYLGSPATVAASAIRGRITDPRSFAAA